MGLHWGIYQLSNGMIVPTLQIRGQWASEKDELNMDSNSWRAKVPNDLRNEGGMFSGPAAPLPFIFFMANINPPREVEHSFHCQQMVRWYVSWIVSWCHDRLVTCWVCCPSRNGLWRCKLWVWCHWWFDRRRTLLCEKSWYQEYRSDLEWLSTCFDHLNSTLCFEGDLSNFLPWPCWKPQWLHDKHLTTPLGFDVLCDGDDFKCGFWLARVDSSKV